MKVNASRVKLFLLATLMLVVALAAEAVNDNSGLLVRSVNNKPGVYKVTYYGGDTGVVTMTIFNRSGKAVFQETLRNSKEFIRLVNLTGMDPGTYTIEVKDGKNKVETKVDYAL
jgi:uncharacterized protein (DUF2141 family)